MENTKMKIYAKIDTNKLVNRVESSISSSYIDFTDWLEIDEGYGDKYALAQNNYLKKGLIDEKGRYNYKWDNKLVELTEEEKNKFFPPPVPPRPTQEEIMEAKVEMIAIDVIEQLGGI